MKEIKLTRGMSAIVDDEDFETLNQFKWFSQKGGDTYYAVRSEYGEGKRKAILMHRLILGIKDPKIGADHKNGNGLDNQRYNLRPCTKSQNGANQKVRSGGGSKYKGVSWNAGYMAWGASIRYKGKLIHIAFYTREIDAAKAYNKRALYYFGEFAQLNIIDDSGK
jgi:hypothetical protein